MSGVEAVIRKYEEGRFYDPDNGGPYPIEDWIMVEESPGWIKGVEKIKEGKRHRFRFVYWELVEDNWEIRRLHPVMSINVVKEIIAEMLLKNWI